MVNDEVDSAIDIEIWSVWCDQWVEIVIKLVVEFF